MAPSGLKLILIIAVLYNGLYAPKDWPQLAEKLNNFSANLDFTKPFERRSTIGPKYPIRRQNRQNNNRNDNGNNRSDENEDGNNGGNFNNDPPRTNYNFQAVACADAADPGNITTKMVFDSLVDSSRTVSPICEYPMIRLDCIC